MITNIDKFQLIIVDSKNSKLTNISLTIENQTVKNEPSVEKL